MLSSRFFNGPACLLGMFGMLLLACPAFAGDNEDALARAIAQYEQGEYLAAQETLGTVDADALSQSDRQRREEYLTRVQVAIMMEDKALRDVEDAETAINNGDKGQARELLQSVLENEYAPESINRVARSMLSDLDNGTRGNGNGANGNGANRMASARTAVAQEEDNGDAAADDAPNGNGPEAVARARKWTERGDDLTAAGRYDEALDAYQAAVDEVPGYPEAVRGLNRVRQLQQQGVGTTQLADEIRRQDAIRWQRTMTQYRELEDAVMKAVAAEQFDEARQQVLRARQVVESGRQFADPVSKYENLRSEWEALRDHVEESEQEFNAEKLEETRRSIEEQRERRIREMEERRREKVEQLMSQAVQHRKNEEYEKAMNVLRQVQVVDPNYAEARWMLDFVEDEFQYRRQRNIREQFYNKTVDALNDVEEAKIPWWKEVNYPDNWPEIISRDTRQIPGKSSPNNKLLGALDSTINADFKQEPFQQAIERLASSKRVNIIVNWHDLARAGVERDTVIDLNLPREITLRKAMTEILDQAGAGIVDLGFDVSDGAITVATQHTIDSNTFVNVYPISDLLMDIPTYNGAPPTDLRTSVAQAQNNAGRDRVPEPLWQPDHDDIDDYEEDPVVQGKIDQLIELIRDTVAPSSWRERGGTIGSIRELNQQLVVTQNSEAQRQIGGLLEKLREQRAIQISVEAIFLTVSSHYLEELGMDLDIVLNAGNAGYDFIDGGGFAAVDPILGSRQLLPRTYSRAGFTPAIPTVGTATTLNPTGGVSQPYGNPVFVPLANGAGGSQMSPVPIRSSVTDFTNPAELPSDIPGSFAGQTIGPALNIMGSFLDNIQVDFMIRATQADSRTTVLTAPRLVVFNGGSAWVAVTIQQNYISTLNPVVAQGAVAQAPITGVIDAGASLFVRGTVTQDRRYVMMLLAPGLTRLLDLQVFPFSGGTGALAAFVQLPTLSTQRIQTMVSVPDGGTLLIGGQKLASETEVEAGVPILSKIPILKRAYSARTTVKDEQTLLILIKPRILIHSEQEELAFPGFSDG